jgi:hypothetical protein
VGLTLATKHKWSAGWTKAWFYYKAPLHVCPRGGKTVHALISHMSAMNFCMKPFVQDSIEDLKVTMLSSGPVRILKVETLWRSSCLMTFDRYLLVSILSM